ncbi:MAG TPA: hypothetical protein VIZ43_08555 [Trebonia sp.]
MAVTKWRRKPEPVKQGGIVAAQHQPGEPLDDLRKIADMAYKGEVAECGLPSGPVLIAAWDDVQDRGTTRQYEAVKPGDWLCYSDDYGSLTGDDTRSMGRWYEREDSGE